MSKFGRWPLVIGRLSLAMVRWYCRGINLDGDVWNARCSISNACVSFVVNVGRDVQVGVRAVFGGGVTNIR